MVHVEPCGHGHPYYDGNGRTARLLATFILHRGGYGLHGFLSIEERHAQDLAAYYRALVVADPSRRKRAYELSATYRQYIGGLSATSGSNRTEE